MSIEFLFTRSFQANDWPWQINCPVCADEWTHHGDVLVFLRAKEDAPTHVLTPGTGKLSLGIGNPSPRRNAVRITFHGECGHDWSLDIIQHKGNTFVAVNTPESQATP